MKIYQDDILVFRTSDPPQEYRVSSIDNQVVKLLDKDGQYRQMPYRNILELINKDIVSFRRSVLGTKSDAIVKRKT